MIDTPPEISNLDVAFDEAKLIVAGAEDQLASIKTEEDAKIQIITRVITECLGWEFSDIGAEVKHDNGYSDYVLSDSGRPCIVVEAKRLGAIDLGGHERGRVRELKISGPALSSAVLGIDQAASYAAPNGIQIAMLTDGMAWIVFKTFTPGENYKSKQAFVFPSLNAVLNSFEYFFDLLSKQQFRKKAFAAKFDLLHNRRQILQRKLVAPIEKHEIGIERKSELAFDLEPIFSTFFAKLTGDDDDDMLIECFVETKESRIADFSLEKITANVLGNLSPPNKDVDKELSGLIERAVEVEKGQTVFIVGSSGAGKSTFLTRFFRKTLSSTIRNQCMVCRANCLDFTGVEASALRWLTDTLVESIESQVYRDGSPTYEELQGLYHREYERRARGVDAHLYARDKAAFKEKFGAYLEEICESDREGYLRRILGDVVRNRKKLPIVIIDNTDEFSLDNKTSFFQFAQALARYVTHCLLLFPVTDKSAWSFSKTDIFGVYQSRSFFLPTPPPREVFRKRIAFLKGRLSNSQSDEARKNYFVGRGIGVSIKNLGGFAQVLESVFVDHDYTSKTIGDLANYNIRRTLLLSKRVITSSVLNIEDLLKSYFVGEIAVPDYSKFMNALMKGDYSEFRAGDCAEIVPIFQVDANVQQSPLLMLRILALMESTRQGGRTIDDRHLSARSVVEYFEAAGCAEAAVDHALLSLFEAGLLESFDASVRSLSPTQRLAISHSGSAHLRLATRNNVFFEQMALTTAITNEETVAQIRGCYSKSAPYTERMAEIRQLFVKYLIGEDELYLAVNTGLDQYKCQGEVVNQLRQLARPEHKNEDVVTAVLGDEFRLGVFKKGVVATVDWFDHEKGFGFADVDGVDGQVFLHKSKLEAAGIEAVNDGDDLLCDVARDNKGIRIDKVHDVQIDAASMETLECEVVRLFPDRAYGFVRLSDSARNAFFHVSLVPASERDKLKLGSKLRAEITPDKLGRGLQVRKISSIEGTTTD